jgi:hypothetical protein
MAVGAMDLGGSIETATAESNIAQQIASDMAGTTMQQSTLPNGGSDEPPMDSALLDQAVVEGFAASQNGKAQEEAQAQTQPAVKQDQQPQGRNRAAERIQEVIKQRNAERDARMQMEARLQAIEARNQAIETQRLELEQQRFAAEQAQRTRFEESQLSETERAKRAFLREAQNESRTAMMQDPAMQQLLAEVQESRHFRQQLVERAQQRARFQKIDQMGKQVLEQELLAGYDPEDRVALSDPMEEMLHAFAGAYRAYPNDPVIRQRFEQFKTALVRAENRKAQRTTGHAVARSQAVPSPLPQSRGAQAQPTAQSADLNQLKRNGFENHIQWYRAGSPPLRKK